MITVNDLFGKKQIIELVKFGDVTAHFDQIKDNVPKSEWTDFNLRMCACVDTKTAFTLSDHSCFLYYNVSKPGIAEGVALYGKNVPDKLLALFAGIFAQVETEVFKLDFKLHSGKFTDEYRSILDPVAAANRLVREYPLSVRIDKLKEKMSKLYEKRGIDPNG